MHNAWSPQTELKCYKNFWKFMLQSGRIRGYLLKYMLQHISILGLENNTCPKINMSKTQKRQCTKFLWCFEVLITTCSQSSWIKHSSGKSSGVSTSTRVLSVSGLSRVTETRGMSWTGLTPAPSLLSSSLSFPESSARGLWLGPLLGVPPTGISYCESLVSS